MLEERDKDVTASGGIALFNLAAESLCALARGSVVCPAVVIGAARLLDSLLHGHALPFCAHVYLRALIGYCSAAADVERDGFIHILDEIHHALIVGVSLIHLYRGKFGVMEGIHALVAENSAHFVDALQTADYQPL